MSDDYEGLLKLFKYKRGVWLCRDCNITAFVKEELYPCQTNPEMEAAIEAGTMSWDDVDRQGFIVTRVVCRSGCGRRWRRKKAISLPAQLYTN